MTQTPAGWYPDPEQQGQQRYWDGSQWTEHRVPVEPTQQPTQQPGVQLGKPGDTPTYQQPGYGQQPYQQPGYQQPGYGQAPYGQPGYGAPQQPGYPAAAYGAYQPPSTSHTARNVLIAIAVVFVLILGGCAALVGIGVKAGNDAVDKATKPHTVTYKVGGTASSAMVTYTDDNANTTPESTVPLPFEKTVTITGSFFNFYSVSATGAGEGTVTCEIIVDGTSIDTDQGTEGFSFALCSGSDPGN